MAVSMASLSCKGLKMAPTNQSIAPFTSGSVAGSGFVVSVPLKLRSEFSISLKVQGTASPTAIEV
jgi:hypothetical protein